MGDFEESVNFSYRNTTWFVNCHNISTVLFFYMFFTLKTKHLSDVRWVLMVPFGDTVFQREAASLCCLITLMCLF